MSEMRQCRVEQLRSVQPTRTLLPYLLRSELAPATANLEAPWKNDRPAAAIIPFRQRKNARTKW